MSDLDKLLSSGNADEVLSFLIKWASETATDVVTLSAIDPVSGKIVSRGYDASQHDEIRGFIGKYLGHWNLYFSKCPRAPIDKKLTEKDVHKVVCVHVDIEVNFRRSKIAAG